MLQRLTFLLRAAFGISAKQDIDWGRALNLIRFGVDGWLKWLLRGLLWLALPLFGRVGTVCVFRGGATFLLLENFTTPNIDLRRKVLILLVFSLNNCG